MKAKVFVRLKGGVLDVQGKAVERGLQENGFPAISGVRIGKLIEFELKSTTQADAKREIEAMCQKILVNPIIESYEISLTESAA